MSKKKLKHIPIIILTASKDEENELRLFKAGVFDYMTKPLNINKLVIKIKALLFTILEDLAKKKELESIQKINKLKDEFLN